VWVFWLWIWLCFRPWHTWHAGTSRTRQDIGGFAVLHPCHILDKDHFALVVHSQKLYVNCKDVEEKEVIVGIITDIDLLQYVTRMENCKSPNVLASPGSPRMSGVSRSKTQSDSESENSHWNLNLKTVHFLPTNNLQIDILKKDFIKLWSF
jgi:hypothetical protein